MADNTFAIRQQDKGERSRLILSGELDLAHVPQLDAAITGLCTAGALEVELDLRELTFVDSSGIRAMITARETCAQHHAEFFGIASRDPGMTRLFELTGLFDAMAWREADEETTDA